MTELFGPKGLMEVVESGRIPPNCDVTLQMKPTFAADGVARGEWTIDEKFVNGIGVCMGGYLAAATDTMMAYAIASQLGEGQTFSTIDLHTTFHRPAFVGVAEVEARVERLGRQVAYLTADVTQNGKKAVSAVSSVMIFSNPEER
ncbi:PaaI family thioesterase [Alicyclobacillus sp. ALC3]|uniref:PaaI family thioesterase n=1 Tax=Alicyclobacillus sp. ALC3 TaxID=2796143 RepID=UPI0023782120|nr:PaaI family thioesterase [Alicyclobacillus sp. ALC3]WDL95973.1 PaaI family thioesterase [Alicyclobacillus sp. ALC3]